MLMPRPKIARRVFSEPGISYFKPAGVRMAALEERTLAVEEFEALRLKDLEGMGQEEAAGKMGISQPTFCRLVSLARNKVADAIVNGKAIRIEGGSFEVFGRMHGFGKERPKRERNGCCR
jgi:predicted DNA-binding protein (UPF0251 family)